MNTGEVEVNTFDKNTQKQEEYFPVVRGSYTNTVKTAEKYFNKADTYEIGDEFASHVAFGLIKCDQALNQENYDSWSSPYVSSKFGRLIKDYPTTKYTNEVRTNCYYYDYYYQGMMEDYVEEENY